jgi:Trp operon repressor
MSVLPRHYNDLYDLICAVKTRKEAKSLLIDLLTPQELDTITERWQEIQLLAAGKTQREISKKLGVSISKVTRGSRVLKYGTGGFDHFLRKLKKPVGI